MWRSTVMCCTLEILLVKKPASTSISRMSMTTPWWVATGEGQWQMRSCNKFMTKTVQSGHNFVRVCGLLQFCHIYHVCLLYAGSAYYEYLYPPVCLHSVNLKSLLNIGYRLNTECVLPPSKECGRALCETVFDMPQAAQPHHFLPFWVMGSSLVCKLNFLLFVFLFLCFFNCHFVLFCIVFCPFFNVYSYIFIGTVL